MRCRQLRCREGLLKRARTPEQERDSVLQQHAFVGRPPRCEQLAPSLPLSTHVAVVLWLCTAYLHTARRIVT